MAWYSNQLRTGLGLTFIGAGTLGFATLAVRLIGAPPLSLSNALSGGVFTSSGSILWLVAYLGYSILCVALSLVALEKPSSADRLMGELARQRAKPWLVATSVALLLLSVSVGGFAAWFLQTVRYETSALIASGVVGVLGIVDLALSTEAAAAIVLMGQAIGSYEVFTGRVLPRRGLLRHWHRNLVLAATYGGLVAASLALPLHPVYHVMPPCWLLLFFTCSSRGASSLSETAAWHSFGL
jgi:hypothetical protein